MISESPKQATAYDKLSDTFDAKLLDFNLKFVTLLATLLIRPLANATDPFFRKNLGCRYFTIGSFLAAGFLWFVAMRLEPLINGFLRTGLELFGYTELAQWVGRFHVPAWVGWGMFMAFSVLAGRNLGAAQLRESNGSVWHSMSRGESIFGSENPARDFIITIVVCLVLGYVSPPLGLLFGLSRWMSFVLARKQQRSIYARYLDEMDRRIEAGNLETTLRDGPSPKTTGGLYCPLPARIKGEHRATVARIVTHSSLRPVPAVEQRPAGSPTSAKPTAADTSSTAPATPAAKTKSASKAATYPVRNLVLGLVIVVALIVGGYFLAGWFKGNSQTAVSPPPVTPTAQAQPSPVTTPAPPQNAPARPVIAPAIQPSALATSLTSVASAEAQAAQNAALLAKQEAARAAAQRLEEARRLQQRAKAVEQLQTMLTTQTEELAKFADLCENRQSANTNKINSVSRSNRASLHEKNNSLGRQTRQEIDIQKTILGKLEEAVRKLNSDQQAAPLETQNYCDSQITIMEKNRQTLTAAWDALEVQIAKAPAPKGLLYSK